MNNYPNYKSYEGQSSYDDYTSSSMTRVEGGIGCFFLLYFVGVVLLIWYGLKNDKAVPYKSTSKGKKTQKLVIAPVAPVNAPVSDKLEKLNAKNQQALKQLCQPTIDSGSAPSPQ